jgi:two-component system chemotaxis sensor kinase CheA
MYYNPWEALIVLVESGESRVGLMVDDLIGQQQIVIKSLDTNVTRSRAVSGAAILGDGKVALILDVHGLIQDLEV